MVDTDPQSQTNIAKAQPAFESRKIKAFTLDEQQKREIERKPTTPPDRKYRDSMKGNFPYALIYTR